MVGVRTKDIASESNDRERLLLEDKLDAISIGIGEFDDIMKKREESKIPVSSGRKK